MSSTTLTILSVILAVVIVAVLAGALILTGLRSASEKRATLATALEGVESEHLRPLEPAVQAINARFETIVGAFPGIAAKAAVVAERRQR